VIAVPGDVVEIRDKTIFINGRRVNHDYGVFSDPRTIAGNLKPRDNLGTDHRAQGCPFCHGRQSGREFRQPFLGVRTHPGRQRQGLYHLLVWDSDDFSVRWRRLAACCIDLSAVGRKIKPLDLKHRRVNPSMNYHITGGRIIDPGHHEGLGDIYVVDGKIAALVPLGSPLPAGETSKSPPADFRIIDARGKIVAPGLIDLHVHLREPGFEHKETIETGCRQRCSWFYRGVLYGEYPPGQRRTQPSRTIFFHGPPRRAWPGISGGRHHQGLEGRIPCDYDQLKQAGAAAISDDAGRCWIPASCAWQWKKPGGSNAGHFPQRRSLPR